MSELYRYYYYYYTVNHTPRRGRSPKHNFKNLATVSLDAGDSSCSLYIIVVVFIFIHFILTSIDRRVPNLAKGYH